ncbi:MAG: isoleucine--tRNA ligase [Verrucomicrobia bacterium]|nr:isoleucine--tRNA ligase [Verrucomicrobiota bacterium]
MLDSVSNKISFPELEEGILKFWEDHGTFRKSLDQRRDDPEYVFYDGPPFATGLPHYGHLLAGMIKDIVPRYHTMRGHYVQRRFGWDCHGLPIEALAQEALGLAGAGAIVEKGVDVFNEQCRSMVQQYVAEWRKTVARMGRWVDFDNDYKTMDLDFMETIWWVFKQLWEQDRIYKAYRIMPYSWKLTTPLSNFEAGNNYKDVQDPAITVRMRITSDVEWTRPTYALAWTTTPWTLPGNLALCVGPHVQYVAVRDTSTGDVYVMAEARLDTYYKDSAEYEVVKILQGPDLVGWTYEPLFSYFKDQPNAFRILMDDFVTTEEGTGIVHMAPAYGEDDYRVCTREGIDLVDPLDAECNFTEQVPDHAGVFCKDADKALIKWLKNEGKLIHQSTIVHSYPFCERTETPLIYRAIDAWYVRVEDMREDLVKNNDGVHWVPSYVGEKRFGNWLRDAKDWNISRNRFWGSCIPVWVAEDGSDAICVGSIDELEELSGVRVTDLHKHHVDKVVIEKDGKVYRRTPEVLDCWFESGSMPYAQSHYPFENKEHFESHFPASFIAEGLDQTRGWFYTLMVLSTALFRKPAFKNVIVNGMILAEDGRKMSKRLKNYPDPTYIMDEYGADALRLYMISSPVVRAEDLCFTEDGVKHSLRHLLIPWWNAYAFFVTYARIDGWSPGDRSQTAEVRGQASENLLDRWILSSLDRLNQEVVTALDVYDLQLAVRPFVHFIEDLTNWYIRRSRRRFWKSSDDEDKQQAYATLYAVLLRLSRIAAPFVPFISESIYQNLRSEDMPESVHLCDYPTTDGSGRDRELERQMDAVMSVVSMGRLLRTEYNLKVRQTLKGLHVVCRNGEHLDRVRALKALITDELNVKEVWFSSRDTDLVDLSAKPNFKRLGPKLGAGVKKAAGEIARLGNEELEGLLSDRSIAITVDGVKHAITADDVVIERTPKEGLAVTSEGAVVVALEIELTDELILEGLAREFVNKVQNMRKTADFDVTQRIEVLYSAEDLVAKAIETHSSYIMAEVLATACSLQSEAPENSTDWDLNGLMCSITVIPS